MNLRFRLARWPHIGPGSFFLLFFLLLSSASPNIIIITYAYSAGQHCWKVTSGDAMEPVWFRFILFLLFIRRVVPSCRPTDLNGISENNRKSFVPHRAAHPRTRKPFRIPGAIDVELLRLPFDSYFARCCFPSFFFWFFMQTLCHVDRLPIA